MSTLCHKHNHVKTLFLLVGLSHLLLRLTYIRPSSVTGRASEVQMMNVSKVLIHFFVSKLSRIRN